MKKVIFYLSILPIYFFLGVTTIMNKDFISLAILVYLAGMGIYLCHTKTIKNWVLALCYFNSLIVFTIVLALASNNLEYSKVYDGILSTLLLDNPSSFSISVLLAVIVCIIILILVNYFSLSREILYFCLFIFTLDKSLINLYLHVENYAFESIVFHFILTILMVTTPKSFKMVKKPKKKKPRVVVE